ncbi:photosystem I protein PsaX [Oscillatoria sp. FACHB-1406]|nr:photosystem I protein PsaX [Oscillatoria sp. FACHB-1406]MBD2579458.1 photosystem I protein PsaX [Oscillatoria sp. FACHB-1406]
MANQSGARSANKGDVVNGLIIFLAINFLVAAMYFKVLNP